MPRRSALLIASYDYDDAGLSRLTAPPHDAESLAEVLHDPLIADFEVTTLINEPNHVTGAAIGDFYRDRHRDDLLLLYFTGHGLKDDAGHLYLAMANTRRDNLIFTGLAAESVDQAMESCNSRRKVLILDCCYSGAYPVGRMTKGDDAIHTIDRFQGTGRTILTASDATQYSFEGARTFGESVQSVFTKHLINGLRDGTADLDNDGDITLDELYGYVYEEVRREVPQQRPKRQDNIEGRLVVARNQHWRLPDHIAEALTNPIPTVRLGALGALERLTRSRNDLVRATALERLARLTNDDSRMVSTAADRLIAELGGPPTTGNGNRAASAVDHAPARIAPRQPAETVEKPVAEASSPVSAGKSPPAAEKSTPVEPKSPGAPEEVSPQRKKPAPRTGKGRRPASVSTAVSTAPAEDAAPAATGGRGHNETSAPPPATTDQVNL